ncbi:MAG: hypothetical protein LBD60_02135 [Puniceicoccales bacterium]|nr:hypothetical protein [Puniceicoccales bacterium]
MNDMENIKNLMDTRDFPIEIVAIGERGEVGFMLGDKPAEIAEPRPNILEKGFVFLGTPDIEAVDWEDLISCNDPEFGELEGFTDDPRLVDIGKKVLSGESFDLKPGTIIPPLKEK